jgi:hypothetical protein
MLRHRRTRRATPSRNRSAWTASAAALIAPAEVPQMIPNGPAAAGRRIRAMARSAPT